MWKRVAINPHTHTQESGVQWRHFLLVCELRDWRSTRNGNLGINGNYNAVQTLLVKICSLQLYIFLFVLLHWWRPAQVARTLFMLSDINFYKVFLLHKPNVLNFTRNVLTLGLQSSKASIFYCTGYIMSPIFFKIIFSTSLSITQFIHQQTHIY